MTDFKDVYILPQYSDVQSRNRVDTTSILDPEHSKTQIGVLVISANMDTVTNAEMALAMGEARALGAVHRFMSIEDNIVEYSRLQGMHALMSVGVSGHAKERFHALHSAGARHFIIDIAHGHHHLMKGMLAFIRKNYHRSSVYVMAGNVATPEGAAHLIEWGADAIKVGIGPGAACITKNVTGVTVPQFTAIQECAAVVENFSESHDRQYVCVADGGVQEIGDIAKALGAGADFVMCGRLFAGCPEAPHPGLYRGMASADAMRSVRTGDAMPTPEGKTMTVMTGPHVEEVVETIAGGLRSAFSYSNSLNLKEFQARCKFGIK